MGWRAFARSGPGRFAAAGLSAMGTEMSRQRQMDDLETQRQRQADEQMQRELFLMNIKGQEAAAERERQDKRTSIANLRSNFDSTLKTNPTTALTFIGQMRAIGVPEPELNALQAQAEGYVKQQEKANLAIQLATKNMGEQKWDDAYAAVGSIEDFELQNKLRTEIAKAKVAYETSERTSKEKPTDAKARRDLEIEALDDLYSQQVPSIPWADLNEANRILQTVPDVLKKAPVHKANIKRLADIVTGREDAYAKEYPREPGTKVNPFTGVPIEFSSNEFSGEAYPGLGGQVNDNVSNAIGGGMILTPQITQQEVPVIRQQSVLPNQYVTGLKVTPQDIADYRIKFPAKAGLSDKQIEQILSKYAY